MAIAFFAAAILSIVALSPGASLSAEKHGPQENQAVSQPSGENFSDRNNGRGQRSDETSATILSEELKSWEDAESINLIEDVPGPGAFLGTMLSRLSAASVNSDDRIKKLVAAIPNVFPDLKKVFITL
jgi:hypothetical protein